MKTQNKQLEYWKDRKISKPRKIAFINRIPEKRKLKSYKVRVSFRATRYETRISKAKEMKLREINKKIDKLQKKIGELFKC